jgi:hypothetical protein
MYFGAMSEEKPTAKMVIRACRGLKSVVMGLFLAQTRNFGEGCDVRVDFALIFLTDPSIRRKIL